MWRYGVKVDNKNIGSDRPVLKFALRSFTPGPISELGQQYAALNILISAELERVPDTLKNNADHQGG